MSLFKSRGLRIAVLASIVVMVGLISMRSLTVNAQPDPCSPCDNEMAIDSLWGNATEEASATHAIDPGDNSQAFEWSVRIRDVTNDYQAYGALVEYNGSIIQFIPTTPKNVTYLGLGGMTSNATALDSPAVLPLRTLEMGSNNPDGAQMDEGEAVKAKFKCIASGTTALTLVPPTQTVGNSTTLDPGGAVISTGLTAGQIVCKAMADIVVEKTDSVAAAVAGTPFNYVITAHNDGPNNVSQLTLGDNLPEVVPDDLGPDGIPGTADDSPAVKVYQGYTLTVNGNSVPACAFYPVFVHPVTGDILLNVLMCNLSAMGQLPPSTTVVLTITVVAPLWDAGKLNVNVGQAGSLVPDSDPDKSNESPDCDPLQLEPANLGCEFTPVLPATLTIVKTPKSGSYSEGDVITWTVTATCSATGSPCADATGVTGPPITDDPDLNQDIQLNGASLDVAGTCTPADPAAGAAVICTPDDPMDPGDVVVMTVLADVVDSENSQCVNVASATGNTDQDGDSDAESFSDSSTVTCLAATVRMEKDIDPSTPDIENEANLWLCDDCAAPGEVGFTNGEGALVIFERVSNAGTDTDGVGAYEFQLKFDHKIFDIEIENYPTPMQGPSWLSDGDTRAVECDYSIVTENWILFGCVSSGLTPGQVEDGLAARITVKPEADLKYRMTPGNNNGIVRPILDENCEIADVWGHPLEIPGWATDGVDNDLDGAIDEFGEGLAPGVVTGGLIEVCGDGYITVRILEGDLDLDCDVDVQDQQAIAWRYGASFGTLLYDPWFDLEPWVKDFDIDIKDLQKVFGRNGSTCADPIPAQDPVPFPW